MMPEIQRAQTEKSAVDVIGNSGPTGLPVADIIGWDVGNWSRCLSYWYPWVAGLNRSSSRVLVLGERNGGISLWFALLGFDVLCTDYKLPGNRARELHKRWRVQDCVTYAQVDIFKMPYPDDHFDVVACKSVIGGLKLDRRNVSTRSLENQKLAIEAVRQVIKPHGVFLGAENLSGTAIHSTVRRVRCKGRVGWRYLQIAEVEWLFEDYSNCEQQPWGFMGTYWPTCFGLNRVAGLADAWLSQRLPADWLYISFLRACK